MANLEHETEFEDVVDSAEEVVENEVSEDVENVDEDTIAAQSIKAHKTADASSKSGMMKDVMGAMAGMSKSDLLDFFNKTMAQFGPGKDYGVGDNSAKNSSSIDMNPSHAVSGKAPKTAYPMPKLDSKNNWAEDVEEMFSNDELTEEFKEKATTIFEAAVNARITTEIVRLEEEFEAVLEEQVNVISEDLSTKIETYLDYVVENWMKENEVAIESTLRNEIMEEFIGGLKNLFAEHYIDVPEDKIEVLEALAAKVDTLENKLDEAITENVELKSILAEEAKVDIFNELAADLALTQQEKFAALAEGIEFDGNLETFTRKLEIIKENYFVNSSVHTSNIVEETFEGETGGEVVSVDPNVNRYVKALSRTVKTN